MCCCSTTWLAVNFRLHCASELGERLNGVVGAEAAARLETATQFSTEMRKHVIEATRPLHGSKRIINTDNFYTSCQLLESLKLFGLYCRGTIRENSKHYPRCFMIAKTDKLPRGTMKQGVSSTHKIIAASWVDGAVVNIVSNADASTTTQVKRLVGREKVSFTAPECVTEYNQGMQGVDRMDQLRSRFSVADGHTFRRWHKKLAMAFIDLARCNAYITWRLALGPTSERDPHRRFVTELTSELLSGSWRNAVSDSGVMQVDPLAQDLGVLRTPSHPSMAPVSGNDGVSGVVCVGMCSKQTFPSSRRRRHCAVCRFEGRYATEVTNFCPLHEISLCAQTYPDDPTRLYLCKERTWTCWRKYHEFYLPEKVFSAKGNVRRTSDIAKAKLAHPGSPAGSNVSSDYAF